MTLRQLAPLAILILAGGTVFKLSSIKDIFYVPMQESWGLTNAQIGLGLTCYAVVQTVTYLAAPYICDRFSKKYLLPIGLVGVGLCGLYLSTLPPLGGFLLTFGALALFSECIFWPALLKAVSLLGNERQQGRLFGYLEAGRGVVDVVIAFGALAVFQLFGEGRSGMQAGILFYAGAAIVVGAVTYLAVGDEDQIRATDGASANSAVLSGIRHVVRDPATWMAGMVIFFVYATYAGLTYFIPFLREIYGMPVFLVGVYGIVNQYGLKMIGGPIGGNLADKVVRSPLRYLCLSSAVAAVFITAFAFVPHRSLGIYVGMTMTLLFGAIIFTQRAVFFAPIGEIGVPRQFSGAAMAVGCLVGYAPSLFSFYLYGSLLDHNPGIAGFRMVFLLMGVFSILGCLTAALLLRRIHSPHRAAPTLEEA